MKCRFILPVFAAALFTVADARAFELLDTLLNTNGQGSQLRSNGCGAPLSVSGSCGAPRPLANNCETRPLAVPAQDLCAARPLQSYSAPQAASCGLANSFSVPRPASGGYAQPLLSSCGAPRPLSSCGAPRPLSSCGAPRPFSSCGAPRPFSSCGAPRPFSSCGAPRSFAAACGAPRAQSSCGQQLFSAPQPYCSHGQPLFRCGMLRSLFDSWRQSLRARLASVGTRSTCYPVNNFSASCGCNG